MGTIKGNVATDAGMLLVWQPEAFATVNDYDSWSVELEDDPDIVRHIDAGDCVPINIRSDDAFGLEIRAATPGKLGRKGRFEDLTERERRYLRVSSEPYLFVSKGSARVSGTEAVTGGHHLACEVPKGPLDGDGALDRLGRRTGCHG